MPHHNKPVKVTGFFALLTPQQREAALAYTGDDTVGNRVAEKETRGPEKAPLSATEPKP